MVDISGFQLVVVRVFVQFVVVSFVGHVSISPILFGVVVVVMCVVMLLFAM